MEQLSITKTTDLYDHMKRELANRANVGTKITSMDREQLQVMVALMQFTDEQMGLFEQDLRTAIDNDTAPAILRIMVKRIESLMPEARDRVEMAVWGFLVTPITMPGTAVIYAAFIHGWLLRHPGEVCRMQNLVFDFPYGVASEQLHREVWEAQKRLERTSGPDNWLDMTSAWRENDVPATAEG